MVLLNLKMKVQSFVWLTAKTAGQNLVSFLNYHPGYRVQFSTSVEHTATKSVLSGSVFTKSYHTSTPALILIFCTKLDIPKTKNVTRPDSWCGPPVIKSWQKRAFFGTKKFFAGKQGFSRTKGFRILKDNNKG